MKQSAAEMAAAVLCPLRQSKEVIHKYINILEELGVLSTKVRVPSQGTKLFVEAWSRFNLNSLSTVVQLVSQCWRVCAQSLISRSATVSVAVQNMGGKFFQPMARVNRIATKSSSPASLGKTRPNFAASDGRKPIL